MRRGGMIGIQSRLAFVAGFAACALAGCSSGDGTNGLEKKSAAEVQQEAATALKGASSVHVKGTGASDGKTAQLDLKIQGTSSSGTLTVEETHIEITKVGDDVYVNGAGQALSALGAPESIQRLGQGKWVKLRPKQLTSIEGFSLDDLASQLTEFDSPLESKVEQTTLDGTKAVVISKQNGEKLYVANTGTAYPLRAILTGDDAGQTDFTEYGASFDITAPPDAVDLTELPAGGPEPLSQQEIAWLDKIGTLRDEVHRELPSDSIGEDNAADLAHIMPKCTSELAAAGPPSPRMQPVHELVVKACLEYDKGAGCFATADRLWHLAGTGNEEELNKAIECGMATVPVGDKLLIDAEIEGFRMAARG